MALYHCGAQDFLCTAVMPSWSLPGGCATSFLASSGTSPTETGFGLHCSHPLIQSPLYSGLAGQDLIPMSLGLSHSLSRYKLKFSPDKVCTQQSPKHAHPA